MPGNMLSSDIAFPRLTGEQTANEKIDVILNYLYMLREQLRYTLGNLDAENFNDGGLEEIADGISEPIYAKIKDSDGNIAELQLTADSLTSRITGAEGSVSTLQQTANSLTSRITSAEGNVSTLQQTSSSLTSRITNAEGNISVVWQTADKINWVVASGTNASNFTMSQRAIDLVAANINLTGYVTFNALSQPGYSTINGSNITTGKVSASLIGANNGSYITFTNDIYLGGGGYVSGINALYFGAYASITQSNNELALYGYSGVTLNGLKLDFVPGSPNRLAIYKDGTYKGYILIT